MVARSPEAIERRRLRTQAYHKTPIGRVKHKASNHAYYDSPEGREKTLTRMKGYRQRPEVQAREQVRLRARNLARYYGLTVGEYDDLVIQQNGRCAICHREALELNYDLHVDHDHTTGVVRGLLCQGCNIMLGAAGDDPGRLRAGALYIETKKGQS